MGEEVLQRWPDRVIHRTMLLVRVVAWGVSALVSLRYALGLYAWRVSEKLEKPRYESLLQLPGGVEIRKYEPYTVVEAAYAGETEFLDMRVYGVEIPDARRAASFPSTRVEEACVAP